MSPTPLFYDIHQQLSNGEYLRLGQLAVQIDEKKRIEIVQFRYNPNYITHPSAQPISPLMGPLSDQTYSFESDGRSFVGFIDDLLPDDWGKRVIARKLGRRFITDLDALEQVGNSISIGATKVTPLGHDVNWSHGIPLAEAESTIQLLYEGRIEELTPDQLEAGLLIQGGSQVGGARSKMLIIDHEDVPCVIKPNQARDPFDYAALEWASLEVCRLAGLPTATARLYELASSVRALIITRFDVSPEGNRKHLLTINSLLKDTHTQMDAMQYSYEDIAMCIKKFSWRPKQDLRQLLGHMLINQALSNTDDHLRNFSMQQNQRGWELCPIYDVHPHQFFRAEHACLFEGSGYLPKLESALTTGKALGLSLRDSEEIQHKVQKALESWPTLLLKAGITDQKALNLVPITQY